MALFESTGESIIELGTGGFYQGKKSAGGEKQKKQEIFKLLNYFEI